MQSRETNEEFAREQENANKGWETCYGAALKARLKWIDQMLMEGTDEAHEKLLAFFADEKEIAPYGNRSNAMIEMIVIMDIYKAEVEMGEAHTIFDRKIEGRRMGETELTAYMRAFRFLMWRLEFTKEADAGEKLIQFLKENQVSPVFLCKAVNTMASDEFSMLCEIMELTLEAKMFRHTYWLLLKMQRLAPGEESIRQMIEGLKAYATG